MTILDQPSLIVILASLAVGAATVYAAFHLFPKKKKYHFAARIESLWIYPIKSCKGIKVDEAQCTQLGLLWNGLCDRLWAISTSNGSFLSQRQEPRMALIEPSLNGNRMELDAPGMEPICFDAFPEPNEKNQSSIKIWDDVLPSLDVGDEIGKWLSTFLKRDGLRMHFSAPSVGKKDCFQVKNHWKYPAKAGDLCAYHDDTAYMILSTESVACLNEKLEKPVSDRNFRPNILVTDCQAFAEDAWTHVQIGDVFLRALNHCTRCILTTVDPAKGLKDEKGEPLATLKKFRCMEGYGNHPSFGMYHTLDNPGTVRVGDPIYVIDA